MRKKWWFRLRPTDRQGLRERERERERKNYVMGASELVGGANKTASPKRFRHRG